MKSTVMKVLQTVDKFNLRCEEVGSGTVTTVKRGSSNAKKGDTVLVSNGVVQGIVSEEEIKTFEV